MAWASGKPVLVNDVLSDQRWPEWSRAAAGLGLLSSVSAPLLAGESALGAVKLYGREASSFDRNNVSLLELFAAQATIFLTNVQARESARNISADLQDALAHREIIAVAKRSLRDVSAELVSSTQLSR